MMTNGQRATLSHWRAVSPRPAASRVFGRAISAHTSTVVTTSAKKLRRMANIRPWIQLCGLLRPWAMRIAITTELKAFDTSQARPNAPMARPTVTSPVEMVVTLRSWATTNAAASSGRALVSGSSWVATSSGSATSPYSETIDTTAGTSAIAKLNATPPAASKVWCSDTLRM
jgi:hypothetical protein